MRSILALMLCLLAGPVAADQITAMNAVRSIQGVLTTQADNAGNMWVVVQNNPQTQWNVVAAALCKVVAPHQARIFLIKIVDVAMVQPKTKAREWPLLGGANCGMVQ